MNLGFHQFLDKKKTQPTHFREKILAAAGQIIINGDHIVPGGPIVGDGFKPKLHTFREDKHDRWKEGISIQMVYRGPKYSIIDHFNKGIPELEKCKGTQRTTISWFEENNVVELPNEEEYEGEWTDLIGKASIEGKITTEECFQINDKYVSFFIDGFCQTLNESRVIAGNDGFNSIDDFFAYFNKDFSGKIIHWTDLRY